MNRDHEFIQGIIDYLRECDTLTDYESRRVSVLGGQFERDGYLVVEDIKELRKMYDESLK